MASGSSTDFGFFKLILETALRKKMLELPKKFVRLYGKTLSSSVCLRPRCGSKWKIGLEKREDKVWLCQGWPEFAKLYALDFGHFLFFKYKGNSQFYVSICDISACEIHYPSIPANLNDPNVYVPKKEKTIGYVESLQMFGSSSSEEKYIPPSSPPQKRTRTNASGECQKEGTHRIRKVKTECTSDDDSGIHSWGAAEVTRSQHRQGKGVAKKGKYGKFQSRNHTSAGLRTLRDGKTLEDASKFS